MSQTPASSPDESSNWGARFNAFGARSWREFLDGSVPDDDELDEPYELGPDLFPPMVTFYG